MTKAKQRRNDLILIVILLAAALAVWGFAHFHAEAGAWVVVTRDGVEEARYPLDEEATLTLEAGDDSNQLVIKDGQADMIGANCPDKLCVHQAAISKAGQSIICLPHKLIVSIEGGEEAEFDVISQ